MIQQVVRVASNAELADSLFLLKFTSADIARRAFPGQFVNIRIGAGSSPVLLRRPFSISRVVGSSIELIFNVVGQATKMLSSLQAGEELDVLGPLGVPFRFEEAFETAIIIAGGLGIAPFPFLTDHLTKLRKEIITFVGSRTLFSTKDLHLLNVQYATEDGSKGYRGNVVECLADYFQSVPKGRVKIFGCGRTRMLSALSDFAQAKGLHCELSLEGDMACGVGICQGCPVEKKSGPKKYALVCTDGPTFDCRDIVLASS
jgi:dihydroorotate dehydrogenase electron transfer subunit